MFKFSLNYSNRLQSSCLIISTWSHEDLLKYDKTALLFVKEFVTILSHNPQRAMKLNFHFMLPALYWSRKPCTFKCKYLPIGTRVKNRNPKKSVKYTEETRPFLVGLQLNEHVFFHPWKSQLGFFSSNFVKRPLNVDHMIFFTHCSRHFLNLRRSKYSPYCPFKS